MGLYGFFCLFFVVDEGGIIGVFGYLNMGNFCFLFNKKILYVYIINKLIDNYYLFSYFKNMCSKVLYIYVVFNNFFKKCNRNLIFKFFFYFFLNFLKKY